jgi:tetratricopeptide (TPR) repeat protein
MRRTLPLHAAVLLPLLLVLPAASQTPGGAAQDTPEALTAAYNQAMQAKDWPAALAAAQQLVDANATSANLLLLANAQLYATIGKSDTGPEEATLATYDRALAAAEQEKPAQGQPDQAWKDGVAKIYVGRGNALLKLKRTTDAIDNYNRAAALSSTPGKALFNICATFYNTGDITNTITACRKCVQADPTLANAWFVLGSSLFADAKADASGKFVVTAECRHALEKYLELAPDGPHAADTKEMLDMVAK